MSSKLTAKDIRTPHSFPVFVVVVAIVNVQGIQDESDESGTPKNFTKLTAKYLSQGLRYRWKACNVIKKRC